MLRSINADRQWVGDISYVDTSAVTITNQQIHKPSRGVVSSRWYIITAGTRVGIFTSWCVLAPYPHPVETNLPSVRTDVAPYTQGIRNAVHRSWPKKSTAFSYFQYALILGTVRLLPATP